MSDWMTCYPRPRMRRDSFFPLRGPWTLNGLPITLPFPPESPASGYTGPLGDTLRYETAFTLPAGFLPEGCRLHLHFGAVDQIADVYVNDLHVLRHKGGYLPFSADITEMLRPGENHLTVLALDKLDPDLPYGKQSRHPHGMWYTPVSGIWQTVWLEAVPEKHIESLRIVPDLTGIELTVASGAAHCEAAVTLDGLEVARASWASGRTRRIDIPEEHRRLWTPDSPTLYGLTILSGRDRVESCFALRTVDILADERGHQRICLNGEPVFLCGVLDQGYFPEGIFLPLTPEGFAQDIRRMKDLGFNLLRKHIKVEPECFYDECDRQGMLVIQDMVSSGRYNFLLDTALPTVGLHQGLHLPPPHEQKINFESHMQETIAHLHGHPCIIGWTLFNEGWGQFDTERLYREMKALDPTRFVDAASGWFRPRETDVDSVHIYFRSKRLQPGKRPMLLSECGGYSRPIEGHLFRPDGHYGYGQTASEAELTAAFERMLREMVLPAIPGGLCGFVYTQLSDVEAEINGLYTYDRQICKVDPDRIRAALAEAHRLFRAASAGVDARIDPPSPIDSSSPIAPPPPTTHTEGENT